MSNLTPGFIILVSLLSASVFIIKREHLILLIVVTICFLPADISVMVGALHFQAIRIIGILSLIRIFINFNKVNIRFNSIDGYFFAYNFLGTLIFIICSYNKFGAFIYKSGVFVDTIIIYIVCRSLIRTKRTVKLVIKTFVYCIITLLPFAIIEYFTATNLFSFVGRDSISFRSGEIRTACTFSHSILFGSFAATMIPFAWYDYIINKNKIALIALFSCLFYVIASSSSGPIFTLIAVIGFLSFFIWRNYSYYLYLFIVFSSITIHFVREKPLWHFIFLKFSLKASSTGYYRYLLIDAAVKDFWDWWILGYGDIGPQWHVKYWPWSHDTFTDITNQYLLIGVRGGVISMILFVVMCYKMIKTFGQYSINAKTKDEKWLWWAFAVMSIGHCVSFLAVAYFGQIAILFYMTVAIAAYLGEGLKNDNKIISIKIIQYLRLKNVYSKA